MKPERAKQLICPFIGDSYNKANNYHGSSNVPSNIKCIASMCMAWRWDKVYSGTPNLYGIYPNEEVSTTDGYCVRLAK